MAELVLGPLLRHVGSDDATIWVETETACEVAVLGARTRTFHVAGHHYALVVVEGLEPGSETPYTVELDGERVWPPKGSPFPPSVVRTIVPDAPLKLLFASCRVAWPHEPPYTLAPDEDERGFGPDALLGAVGRMLEEPSERWPHAVLFLGDQVYADEVAPQTLEFIRSRRDTGTPPGEEVADFEEYTRLYREAWGENPALRWFLSTVSSAMLFDDHDVHDDWNISQAWVERMRARPWWEARIVGAFTTYWIYQHLGNLSPRELADDDLYARVREADDAAPLLREFSLQSDREAAGTRWSFCRDFGGTRMLGIDCRAGRVLEPGRRRMVDDHEWEWIVERTTEGDVDHLLLGMSDPFLLASGLHDLQAWSEAVANGRWGHRAARVAESLRESLDLDHWASFEDSFGQLARLLEDVGSRSDGRAPASIVAMSGDVHNAYLAEVAFRRGSGVESRVYQAVCSPLRNALAPKERRAQKLAASPIGTAVGRLLAVAAGVARPPIRWRILDGPSFENQIATLEIDGRTSDLTIERAAATDGGPPTLEPVVQRRLASALRC